MKIFILIISILLISSCKTSKNLEGQVYELSDSEQKIKLEFITANTCRIEQSYKCEKLPDTFSYLTMDAKYKVVKREFEFSKYDHQTLNFIIFKNSDSNSKKLENYSYIENYEEICLPKVAINSNEYKLRQKLQPGVILNLVYDSLLIKKDTIIFGYKKVPRSK